ncbi:hypothetical protein SAMN05192541_14324 [Bradyrhizobium arachidis]|nr:hypothetical protein SAMN05192541_14324 [Bradyrhizobium arachidis]
MLEMLLVMTGVGTATMALIVAGLEWQALRGYWRSRGKHSERN